MRATGHSKILICPAPKYTVDDLKGLGAGIWRAKTSRSGSTGSETGEGGPAAGGIAAIALQRKTTVKSFTFLSRRSAVRKNAAPSLKAVAI
jgi:hypothetical protein